METQEDRPELQSKVTVLRVDTDLENSTYSVSARKGSTVNEMAFAVSVVIKTLVRDGYIKNYHEFMKLIKKYCTDSQYEEVTNDKQ